MVDATVCRQCGSIRVREVTPRPLERLVATLTRQRVVICSRCGWRGRVSINSGSSSSGRHRRRHREHHEEPSATELLHTDVDLEQIDKALEKSKLEKSKE
jgi:ribosomal protein L40E